MAWRIVKQPDGRYARWSDIVDGFTHVDMDRDEAIEVAHQHITKNAVEEAQAKVDRADKNPGRWEECQELMRILAEAEREEDE